MAEITGLTGFLDVTINTVDYVVDAVDMASETGRVIERRDSSGDRADYEIRQAAEHITGTMTLQRATSATAFPPLGQSFSYDYDSSGTASTLRVTDVQANRSKDEMLTFEIGVLVDTYQG